MCTNTYAHLEEMKPEDSIENRLESCLQNQILTKWCFFMHYWAHFTEMIVLIGVHLMRMTENERKSRFEFLLKCPKIENIKKNSKFQQWERNVQNRGHR